MSGHVTVITGPMYSGKSSTLIRYIDRALSIRQRAIIVSPATDTRSANELVCHSGEKRKVIKLETLTMFLDSEDFAAADIIGVDEAQFFKSDDLYNFVCEASDNRGKTIIVAGLDTNFKREPFGGVIQTIGIADEVCKLSALCAACGDGTKAIFTKRLPSEHTGVILVGGQDCYQSVCRYHYKHEVTHSANS